MSRGATESDPENKKVAKIALGTGIFGKIPPYLLRRQDHPPAPHPSSFPWQLARPPPAGSLSLSLFLSNDSARRGASASGQYGCIQPSRNKKFEPLGRHLLFTSRSAGFPYFYERAVAHEFVIQLPQGVRCSQLCAMPVQHARAPEQAQSGISPTKHTCDKQVSSWRHINCHIDKNRYYT